MSNIRHIPFLKLDKRAEPPLNGSEDAAGWDLTAISMEIDPVNRCVIYDTGLALELPRGYFGDLRSRSSIYKRGPFILANGAGVVDSDYRGSIKVIFTCVDADWGMVDKPPYEVGDRIAQLVLTPFAKMAFHEYDKLSETSRNLGGFGSTGNKGKEPPKPKLKLPKKEKK